MKMIDACEAAYNNGYKAGKLAAEKKIANCKCTFPNGIIFKPDGKNEIDPCIYRLKEIHRNVTVEIGRCPVCGAIDISWYRQDDTEDEIIEED